jgi:hypothetical protein
VWTTGLGWREPILNPLVNPRPLFSTDLWGVGIMWRKMSFTAFQCDFSREPRLLALSVEQVSCHFFTICVKYTGMYTLQYVSPQHNTHTHTHTHTQCTTTPDFSGTTAASQRVPGRGAHKQIQPIINLLILATIKPISTLPLYPG